MYVTYWWTAQSTIATTTKSMTGPGTSSNLLSMNEWGHLYPNNANQPCLRLPNPNPNQIMQQNAIQKQQEIIEMVGGSGANQMMSVMRPGSGVQPDRKKIIIFGGGGTLLVFVIIIILVVAVVTSSGNSATFRGRDVLSEVPLIDGHNDLPFSIYLRENKRISRILENFHFDSNLTLNEKWNQTFAHPQFKLSAHTDLLRLREGKLGGQFWVAYANCQSNNKDAVSVTLEQIDVIKRLINKYPDDMQFVTTADGIVDAFWNNKIASLIGVEGGHSIDSRTSIIRLYYELGVRYMTLTHNCNTPWADFNGANENNTVVPNGLTAFGRDVVWEMNRLGMLVDMSHYSNATMKEVLNITKAPVIFSHSAAYKIQPISRNVDDDVLELLALNKGIIMIPFGTFFLVNSNVTIDTVIEHLDHTRNVTTSTEYVGIGSDFDGVSEVAIGLDVVSKYPELFDRLAIGTETHKAWCREDLRRLAGENFLRVMKAVEKFRDDNFLDSKGTAIKLKEVAIPVKDFNGTDTSCRTEGVPTTLRIEL